MAYQCERAWKMVSELPLETRTQLWIRYPTRVTGSRSGTSERPSTRGCRRVCGMPDRRRTPTCASSTMRMVLVSVLGAGRSLGFALAPCFAPGNVRAAEPVAAAGPSAERLMPPVRVRGARPHCAWGRYGS